MCCLPLSLAAAGIPASWFELMTVLFIPLSFLYLLFSVQVAFFSFFSNPYPLKLIFVFLKGKLARTYWMVELYLIDVRYKNNRILYPSLVWAWTSQNIKVFSAFGISRTYKIYANDALMYVLGCLPSQLQGWHNRSHTEVFSFAQSSFVSVAVGMILLLDNDIGLYFKPCLKYFTWFESPHVNLRALTK